MQGSKRSNFDLLKPYEQQLWRLGALAERYFTDDPNTCLLKLRQLAELLTQFVAARIGLYVSAEESQYDLIRRLQADGFLPREIKQLLDQIRVAGNAANHALEGSHAKALASLRFAWQLALWFHRTFKDQDYRSGPFLPPAAPDDESAELKQQLDDLRSAVVDYQAKHEQVQQQLNQTQSQLSTLAEERSVWEQVAVEAEEAKAALSQRLEALQTEVKSAPQFNKSQLLSFASAAASQLYLDESQTRRLIDEQLRQAGWEADTEVLRFSKGIRPQKGRNMAIAEWPCEGYSADYVLFCGLTPIAVVEAKRETKDVSGSLQQSKRYSRTFSPSPETVLHAENWGDSGQFRIPFAFATNGRPYLRQLATKSGVWFCDLRRGENLSHALDGWYTPVGLQALLKKDEAQSHADLQATPFNFGFPLRHYQQAAVQAVEGAIGKGQREILLAMATGTGKTKTCIALIYRLLKVKRFQRVLFLVDRSALGEQAVDFHVNLTPLG